MSPHSPQRPESWVEHATNLLEHSTSTLDAATLSRLNRARQAALAQRDKRWSPIWLGGGALAGACALALVVALRVGTPPDDFDLGDDAVAASNDAPVTDDDVLATSDNLDLYQDLDFYAWLDAQDQGADG